jgi:hypothetical protein
MYDVLIYVAIGYLLYLLITNKNPEISKEIKEVPKMLPGIEWFTTIQKKSAHQHKNTPDIPHINTSVVGHSHDETYAVY